MDDATVGQVMGPPSETVAPGTPVATVKRRMEGEMVRSLVVAEGGRPVGVVRWRDVSGAEGERTAADVMLRELPAVQPETPLAEAREQVHDVDLDLVPVTDGAGHLVGEVARARLVFRETHSAAATAAAKTTAGQDREHTIHLEAGMEVVGADGGKVGTVDEVIQDAAGRITHLRVKQGPLRKHLRRLPVDLVSAVQDRSVTLTITGEDVGRLPDQTA